MPATSGHYLWLIRVNAVYGQPAGSLSTTEQYYFTLPELDTPASQASEPAKAADLSRHPVLGRFPSSSYNGRKYVVLARDNRLPFVKLTKGEYSTPSARPSRINTSENASESRKRTGATRPGSLRKW